MLVQNCYVCTFNRFARLSEGFLRTGLLNDKFVDINFHLLAGLGREFATLAVAQNSSRLRAVSDSLPFFSSVFVLRSPIMRVRRISNFN